MSTLSRDQIQACRDNPLRAYLARTLPSMLKTVTATVTLNLLLVGLSVFSMSFPGIFTQPMIIHLGVALAVSTNLVAGLVIGSQLRWMKQHHLTPEDFLAAKGLSHMPPVRSPGPVQPQAPWPIRHPLPEGCRPNVDTLFSDLINRLRSDSKVSLLKQMDAETRQEREYQRSLEVLLNITADILDASRHGLQDKLDLGHAGTGTGFRQLEMTAATLQRITRTCQAGVRQVHIPKRNTCKGRNAEDNGKRRPRAKERHPGGRD